MFTIIGADGKEYGPVPADKLREWIANGRANAQTQCRRDGEAAWSTLGSLPEFAASFAYVPPPPAVTALTPEPTIDVDPKAYAESVLAAGGRVDVFDCIGKGFSTWTRHFLPLVGVTLVIIVLMTVIGMIPLINLLANLLLTGVFYGGLFYYYLGKMRGEPRQFSDAFAGFSQAVGPLMLCTLIQTVGIIALAALLLAPVLGSLIPLILSQDPEAMMPTFAPFTIAAMGVCFLGILFLSICWIFAYALVIDKRLGAWPALAVSFRVVSRNWFSVFFVGLLGTIIGMLGVVALIVGVFLTIPITIASVLHAYESLFNPTRTSAPTV